MEKFLSKDRKIAFVFDQDLQVKTKKGLRKILYEKSVLKSNSRKFSVTDDAEILDLLDAPSEVVAQYLRMPPFHHQAQTLYFCQNVDNNKCKWRQRQVT